MDDLSLDTATVDAQLAEVVHEPATGWHARRALRIGASDVPAVLLAYDPRPDEADTARAYHLAAAAPTTPREGLTIPFVLARKLGLRRPERMSSDAARGASREVELLERWASIRAHWYSGLRLASKMAPWEMAPRDLRSDWLQCTLDASAIGFAGRVVVEAKCTRDMPRGLAWYWRAQVQAQMACTDASEAVVVVGPGWATGADAEPIWHVVDRDESEIARIRRACTMAGEDMMRARRAMEER